MKWKITLQSVDKHLLLVECEAPNEQQARAIADERIIELGWEHHQYKFLKLEKISEGESENG